LLENCRRSSYNLIKFFFSALLAFETEPFYSRLAIVGNEAGVGSKRLFIAAETIPDEVRFKCDVPSSIDKVGHTHGRPVGETLAVASELPISHSSNWPGTPPSLRRILPSALGFPSCLPVHRFQGSRPGDRLDSQPPEGDQARRSQGQISTPPDPVPSTLSACCRWRHSGWQSRDGVPGSGAWVSVEAGWPKAPRATDRRGQKALIPSCLQ
jgi:hypothetical protein